MIKNKSKNDVVKNTEMPNSDTIDAFKEFDVIKNHSEKYKRYNSFSDALKDLHVDI